MHSVLGKSTPNVRDVFKFESVLGKGSFGTTYLVTHLGTHQEYACKSIPKHKLSNRHQLEAARVELAIQRQLSGHPNIVTLQGVYEDQTELHIILELCSGGTIYDVLIKSGIFSESLASKLMQQVITSVAYCHNHGIIHRDIKLENFLLSDPSPDAVLKLADFGLSKFTTRTAILTGCCGTPQYMAPEVLNENYTMQADLWSCGVVLYIILSGTYPFPGSNQDQIKSKIRAGPPDMKSRAWEKISGAAKDCIQKLLNPDPAHRPTAEEILRHPFLSGECPLTDSPLDAEVILQLRRFVGVLRFKQEAAKKLASLLPAEQLQKLKDAYKVMDTNRDGEVTVDEMSAELQRRGVPPGELAQIADSVDLDHNGLIDINEFMGAAVRCAIRMNKEQLVEHVHQVFKQFDTDGDGFIDRKELSAALEAAGSRKEVEGHVMAALSAADDNKDGLIDFEEFRSFLRQEDGMTLLGLDTQASIPRNPAPTFHDIYAFGAFLRSCMYGAVYEIRHRATGQSYACKTISKVGLPPRYDFRSEERILRRVAGHPSIIALQEANEGANHLHLVTELCTGPDLFSLLATHKRLTEADAASALACVLHCIAHCHRRGVVHRDIRAETFLQSQEDSMLGLLRVKAADLALAVEWKEDVDQPLKEVVGSLYYIAPEVLEQQYGAAADVWSAGILMYVLLAGKYPFRGASQHETFSLIRHAALDMNTAPWPHVSEAAKDLLARLLDRSATTRITAAAALEHPWLKEAAAAVAAPGVHPEADRKQSKPLSQSAMEGLKQMTALETFRRKAVAAVLDALKKPDRDQLLTEFRSIDKDNSGHISVQALKAWLQRKQPQNAAGIDELAASVDVDQDGLIDLQEFVGAVVLMQREKREQELHAAFQAMDVDNSGFLGAVDVKAALAGNAMVEEIPAEQVQEVLRLADGNGDGRIDYKDFVALLRGKVLGFNNNNDVGSMGIRQTWG